MTYDLKCPVEVLSGTISDFVLSIKAGDFILFSETDYGLGDRGIWIRQAPFETLRDGVKHIQAHVGPDERFVRTLDGHWVRAVTVKEIFMQFGGSWGCIAAIHTGKDRLIWWSEQVQASLPKVYVLGEDGHQETVIERAWDMGYGSFLIEDCLVMVRKDALL